MVLAVGIVVAVTAVLVAADADLAFAAVVLLLVVVVDSILGFVPGLVAAVLAAGALTYWFTPPFHSFTINRPDDVLALVAFVAVSAAVAATVARLNRLRHQAELQWRLSIPLLVFVVTLLAVPLAKVNPRQGRFLKLLPAILLYMAYLALLIGARGQLDKGRIPMQLGLWWVHVLFLLIGAGLFLWQPAKLALARRRAAKEVAHA